jgi:hypothetical protein
MNRMILGRGAVIVIAVAAAMTLSRAPLWAQTTPQTTLTGLIHDYTPSLDEFGPWEVVGQWTITVNAASGKAEFLASLNMLRSDNATRMQHTHHMRLSDAQVRAIATGYRISGTASFTSNGSLAGFAGSPVDVEITGSSAVPYANVTVLFGGAAAAHFGPQIKGVVAY